MRPDARLFALTFLVPALLVLATAPLGAVPSPPPGPADPRLRWVTYNPRDVIDITAHYGYQTLVQFSASEEITDISIGDSLAWQVDVPARKHMLFLKPVEAYATTNLTVLTTRPAVDGAGGRERIYVFSLAATVPREEGVSAALRQAERAAAVATQQPPDAGPPTAGAFTWVIRFHYPEDEAEQLRAQVQRDRRRQAARISGRAGSEAGIDPAAWNWRYAFAGSETQAPVFVFDDGHHTYFQFDPTTPVPAIFLVHEDETESLVNVVRRGRFLVVHDVGRQFTLRNGTVETCIFNEAYTREPARTLNSPREDPDYLG